MSALSLAQTLTAISPGLTSSFLASGGTEPYTYSIRTSPQPGAGGSIDAVTGLYSAPASIPVGAPLAKLYDTIVVTDSDLIAVQTATAQIFIGTPLLLLCEIIQNQLGLAPGRVYLWDQKIFQPSDNDLYVAVSVARCKPFGNNISSDGSGSGLDSNAYVNMQATVDIDIISRGPAARDQKELVLAALFSQYSQAQQEANSFYVARLPVSFINLSFIDGAAIPYRFKISVAMQYTTTISKSVPYYDTFQAVSLVENP